MPQMPREHTLDSSLAFLREGYEFVGRRCRDFNSDIFQTRLLGRRFYCTLGEDAAKMFYEPERFTRRSALPASTLKLLQDKGSVATLDGTAHHHRKEMMLSLMRKERLQEIAERAADALQERAAMWRSVDRVVLHDEFRLVLCRAVCEWAGMPLEADELQPFTRELGAMIDNAGTVGPKNWAARLLRLRAERRVRHAVEAVRAGSLTPLPESALAVISRHRDPAGNVLDASLASVEILNIIRPTVAIARFMAYGALALHRHPETRDRVSTDDAYREAFVQEVRRFYPFFPVVAGIARAPFDWRGFSFEAGDRFILDLYGTDHDQRLWPEPEKFRPERFLGWRGNAYSLIPQGGGGHAANHRCAGEWLTIAVMKTMLLTLARDATYDLPEQDLYIDLGELPAKPRSGVVGHAH
ncbi:cytochrome P450 [Afifella sp. JA880]|uniref:cytochrome P450 n=1 Tax=Afifella sp. JA880 TaxID=2975280 RepID=UPI0021BB85D6|nr:cytochrome P450 [Afifella sp. JA880]MCT8266296.1 cytochrome P450 [Afifella sp. JA880]